MARPVEPPDAQAPPAPPATPADLLPDLQAKIELATRTLAILERRIAAWESELNEVKKTLRDRPEPTDAADAARMGDLEARLARLERRQLRQQARDAAGEALAKAAGAGVVPIGLGGEDVSSKAVVFARWSSNEARAGEVVKLSALVDGFGPDEEITFTITALDGSRVAEPLVARSGGKDMAEVKWKAPAPTGRPSAEFYFEATGGGQVARSPVLTVTKA